MVDDFWTQNDIAEPSTCPATAQEGPMAMKRKVKRPVGLSAKKMRTVGVTGKPRAKPDKSGASMTRTCVYKKNLTAAVSNSGCGEKEAATKTPAKRIQRKSSDALAKFREGMKKDLPALEKSVVDNEKEIEKQKQELMLVIKVIRVLENEDPFTDVDLKIDPYEKMINKSKAAVEENDRERKKPKEAGTGQTKPKSAKYRDAVKRVIAAQKELLDHLNERILKGKKHFYDMRQEKMAA